MKARHVMDVLRITRPTLSKYVTTGLIKATKQPNGQYDYDAESVYALLHDGKSRKTALYASVSYSEGIRFEQQDVIEHSQRNVHDQLNRLKHYAHVNGFSEVDTYVDYISISELNNNNGRSGLMRLIYDVINHRVSRVIISNEIVVGVPLIQMLRALCRDHDCDLILLDNPVDLPNAVIDFIHTTERAVVALEKHRRIRLDDDLMGRVSLGLRLYRDNVIAAVQDYQNKIITDRGGVDGNTTDDI